LLPAISTTGTGQRRAAALQDTSASGVARLTTSLGMTKNWRSSLQPPASDPAEPEQEMIEAPPQTAPVLSVVIPAYNEEHGIDAILDRVLAQREALSRAGIPGLEVIVVDDGSGDQTAARVERFVERDSSVRLIRHPVNRGYGAALKTGFAAARGDLLAFLDADGTYPPESFPELCSVALTRETDVLIGSRMMSQDSEMPLVRRLGNTIFATMLSLVGARRVYDSASGMRILRRDALRSLYPLPDGLDFTPAMSTRALYEDLKVVEVPIPYRERVGRSKLNVVKDGLRFTRSIMWPATLYNPVRIFGALGAMLFLAGFLLGLPAVLFYLRTRTVPEDQIYRLFMVLILVVAGLNVMIFGLVARGLFNLLPGRRQLTRPLPRRFAGTLAWSGLLMLVIGGTLIAPAGLEWLETRHITYHWSYFAAAGTLILTGLQLVTWVVLLIMVGDLTSRPDRAERDLLAR
jgi:glycosyltransferase involved in cell wall biosynthesis